MRHGGYIPWDDDIDVVMPRRDYERFIRDYIPPHERRYVIESVLMDGYYLPFAKLADCDTLLVEGVDASHPIGVNVDVYPLDNLSDDRHTASRFMREVGMHRAQLLMKNLTFGHRLWVKNLALALGKAALFWRPKRRILEAIDRDCRRYAANEMTRYVGIACTGTYGEGEIHESRWYGERIVASFEGKSYYIPVGYDQILHSLYGDYMTLPSEEKRVSHHRFHAYRLVRTDAC